MDGRTAVGGLLAGSGLMFAYVAARAVRRGLASDAGTPALIALGGITLFTLAMAALGVSLILRGSREEPGATGE
ncbi:hypothetical protein [Haloglomus litoreum]|jgi:hypothetical protein|uniref:hypothetical protein n=1 Tax=Haloglomus litoreum TaxID=3034026 RepID=UPI0023E8A022|nr:hypothetical protein [Haloglomus sp. DT116]